ncbi:MAG TPA: hypothetical protein DDW31_04060 [candidate division Zixibacteria bacterium]|jgi:glycosyltransferase involved in cell wall biosynthesis|nr:hypothetical protein [candidate division Zixibacteria bacterium]
MNILFITPSDKTGGGNRVMFELAARLSRRHRVTCAFPRSPGRPKYRIAPEIRTVAAGFGSEHKYSVLPNLLSLYGWLTANKNGFDAIVSTGQITGILLPYLRHRRLFNYIQSDEYAIMEQGHLRGRPLLLGLYSRLMSRSLVSPGIRCLFNSEFSLRAFTSRHPGRGDPGAIIHPGVDATVFRPALHRDGRAPLTIASLARPHALKGLDVLLRAYRDLPAETRAMARWRLITTDDLQKCGVPGSFEIIRPQNDTELAGLLQQADIFLSTSLWEGFGLPALEAMACGCAVVTSRNGGCDEYAVHGRNCLTYPPGDPAALAGHVQNLLGDSALRSRLAAEGVRTARRFSWEASAGRLLEILEGAP